MPPDEKSIKLQKALALAGLGSRRKMEVWISDGRVKVNGRVAELGARVTAEDRLAVDGRPVAAPKLNSAAKPRVIRYHKPTGELCTREDPQGRPTIFHGLPRLRNGRWISVGRLDLNSSGLLLLTDNGDLANNLMHPRHQIVREYAVRVRGEVTQEMLRHLRSGVELEDGMAHFDDIKSGGGAGANQWFTVTLREGRNREVRRMWASQGLEVSRLIRTAFGPVRLPRWLSRGKFEDLSEVELSSLLRLTELPGVAADTTAPRGKRRK